MVAGLLSDRDPPQRAERNPLTPHRTLKVFSTQKKARNSLNPEASGSYRVWVLRRAFGVFRPCTSAPGSSSSVGLGVWVGMFPLY